MIMGVTAAALLIAMLATLIRAVLGPTVYDRILAVNAFGTLTVVLIAWFVVYAGRPDFIDIAIAYALITFIGTIAVTKYVEYSHLGVPMADDDPEEV